MSFRKGNLWTLSAVAVLFSGCYFWTDPPLPADDTTDTSAGSETEDNGTEHSSDQTDSENPSTESATGPSTDDDDTGSETETLDTASESASTGTESETGSESEDTQGSVTDSETVDTGTGTEDTETSGSETESDTETEAESDTETETETETESDECLETACEEAQLCEERECDGEIQLCTNSGDGWEWSTSEVCGMGTCPDNACHSTTLYYSYPATCIRYCKVGEAVCDECTCQPSETDCTAGGCCAAACDDATGCFTTNGACPDTCGTTILTTGRACTGCGANGADGSCSAGISTTCSATNACETKSCGGTTYRCAYVSGSWQWHASATSCDDGNPCTANDACDGSTCAGMALADGTACTGGLCREGACTESECFISGNWYTNGNPTTGCSYCDTSKSRTSWSTRDSSYSCGVTPCPDDSCTGTTQWNDYPSSCQRYCSGTSGDCSTCTCAASSVACTAGGCCVAACDDATGCLTTNGTCPDNCGTTTLTTGRTCTGCGANGTDGTCGGGTSTTCSAIKACETMMCGGTTYHCIDFGGTWTWSDSFDCSGGTCKDGKCWTPPDSEFTDCGGGKLDSETNLCWQDPPSSYKMGWYFASGTYHDTWNSDTDAYCGDLVQGGHSDWRLPNIDELITLIRGCEDGTATWDLSTSLCEMTPYGCWEDASGCSASSKCNSCSGGDGPASGWYWDPALSESTGSYPYRYWSSSSNASIEGYAWDVNFYGGNVGSRKKEMSDCVVRCVRDGP